MEILIFALLFMVVFLPAISRVVQSERKERKIRQQPVLSVLARVLTKYSSMEETGEGRGNIRTSASCRAVFELKTGECKTLEIGSQYWMLAEGDKGILTYQGDRCLSFQRQYGAEA